MATVAELGAEFGKREEAEAVAAQFRAEMEAIRRLPRLEPPPRALFVLAGGNRPQLIAGRDSLFTALIEMAGGLHPAEHEGYKLLSPEALIKLAPEIIFVIGEAIGPDGLPIVFRCPGWAKRRRAGRGASGSSAGTASAMWGCPGRPACARCARLFGPRLMLLDRRAHPFSEALIFAALLLAVLIVPLFALSLGAVEMPLGDLLRLLWDGDPARAVERAILWEIRLPRVLLALVSGAALAVAGALMQTLFRNPLADPGLIGSSAGAALAAAIVLIALPEWLALASWVLPLSAFVGALLAMLAALALASRDGRYAVADLLLAGIAINALCSSAIGLLVYLAADDQLRAFTLWTLGSLAAAKPEAVAAVALALLLAFALAFWQRRALDALLLGEGRPLRSECRWSGSSAWPWRARLWWWAAWSLLPGSSASSA